jgi:hypothetical protein
MLVISCVAGATLGLVIAMVAGRLALPMVLRSQEAHWRDGRIDTAGFPLPAALRDPRRLRSLTIVIYRYWMPLVFAAVGATAAYYLTNGAPQ